jgi:hypothetical protein
MHNEPLNEYAAFDFFVTAEHLVDWHLPRSAAKNRRKEREEREAFRNSESLLQLVSHIANGAKHFEAMASHHRSVDDLESNTGGFSPAAFSTKAFSPSAFKFAGLTVKLSDGSSRHVLDIAKDVIKFWRGILGA